MEECRISEKPIVYSVETTGLWGEAVRQRRPIITNDYQEPNPWKKGYPQGHVRVTRHMNVPVFEGERIVLVAGVGNIAKSEILFQTRLDPRIPANEVQTMDRLLESIPSVLWRSYDCVGWSPSRPDDVGAHCSRHSATACACVLEMV